MATKKDNKTIGITIRFWTDNLPDKVGKKKDQTPFWTGGNVHLHANQTKKIKGRDELFYYLDDIPRAIKEVMKKSKMVAVTDISYTLRAEKREKNKK